MTGRDANRDVYCGDVDLARRPRGDLFRTRLLEEQLGGLREAFGASYGVYWEADPEGRTLRFGQDSGSAADELRRSSREARFREGESLPGQAWRSRDLLVYSDRAEQRGCNRSAAGVRAGLRGAASR